MQESKPPIVITCFDRIEYAAKMTASLRQVDGIYERPIFIYQDGATHRDSGALKARQQDLDLVGEILTNELPHANFVRHGENLGIGLAMAAAQEDIFRNQGFPVAYFMEDDVVLSTKWLTIMDKLQEAVQSAGHRGFFSAYGAYGISVDAQMPVQNRIELAVRHLRAYGQTREHAHELYAFLTPFYKAIRNLDYADVAARSTSTHEELYDWFAALGSMPMASSQDGFRDWGSRVLGYSDFHTMGSWVRYIGEIGVHERPEGFREVGYAQTGLLETVPDDLFTPSVENVAAWNAQQLCAHEERFFSWSRENGNPPARKASLSSSKSDNTRAVSIPLTLPSEEAALLKSLLATSQCYLEYGSGGSTVLAADLDVSSIITVETDRRYLDDVVRAIGETKSNVTTVHVDIGNTKPWGYPSNSSNFRNWPDYPFSGWRHAQEDCVKPDLVLVDGRFRVASFLVSWSLASIGTNILLDDYLDRAHYHEIELVVQPQAMVGRMAVFTKFAATTDVEWQGILPLLSRYLLDPQ